LTIVRDIGTRRAWVVLNQKMMHVEQQTKSSTAGQVCLSDEPMKVFLTSAPSANTQTPELKLTMLIEEDATVDHLTLEPPPGLEHVRPLDQTIQRGSVVLFYGLALTKSLNGACGVVNRWHVKKQLWVVAMADGSEVVAKADNLRVVVQNTPAVSYPLITPASAVNPGIFGAAGTNHQGMMLHGGAPQHFGTSKVSSEPAKGQQAKHSSRSTAPFSSPKWRSTLSTISDSTSIGDSSSDEEEACSTQTTVMMRGIPNSFTRDALVDLLDSQGFAGCCNLVYMPIDMQTEAACGYASVTLFTHSDAERLRSHFEGFADWPMVSDKVCWTSWSQVDGLLVNVERYRNIPAQHESVPDQFKPVLFNKFGKRVPFPSPTKKIIPTRVATSAKTSTKLSTN
jgi:hypothetical protein